MGTPETTELESGWCLICDSVINFLKSRREGGLEVENNLDVKGSVFLSVNFEALSATAAILDAALMAV
jgi:hypothetical protein